jgi:ribosomal protein S18 acetylase RimI-like enzyme
LDLEESMSASWIREAAIAVARAIAEVQVAGWHAAYRGLMPDATLDAFTVEVRESKWASNLAEVHEARRTTVLEREGRVVAFATSGPSRDEPESGELWALYVAPHAWRTGAGRALLEDALRFLEGRGHASTMLTVLEGNARAIRFYEAAGFRLEGERLEKEGLGHFRMRRVRT